MRARRAVTATAIATGLMLSVAGCGSDDGSGKKNTGSESAPAKGDEKADEEPTEPEEAADKTLTEVTGGEDITLTINSAKREEGGFLTVTGSVRNGGSERWLPVAWGGDEKELMGNAASMAGASVVDTAGKKRYLILRDTEGRCLCTQFKGGFKSGEERSWFAQFPAPPESATKIDFQIADMPPATIDLSEGE